MSHYGLLSHLLHKSYLKYFLEAKKETHDEKIIKVVL